MTGFSTAQLSLRSLTMATLAILAACSGGSKSGDSSTPVAAQALLQSPVMNQAAVQFLGLNYDGFRVNRALQLTLSHKYRLQLRANKTPDGPAHLRVGVLEGTGDESAAPEASSLMTSWEGDVVVQSEVVTRDITLSIPDMAQATFRNRLVFDLSPASNGPQFSSGRVEGTLGALATNQTLSLVPSTIDLTKLIQDRGAQDLDRKTKTDAANFLGQYRMAYQNIELISPSDFPNVVPEKLYDGSRPGILDQESYSRLEVNALVFTQLSTRPELLMYLCRKSTDIAWKKERLARIAQLKQQYSAQEFERIERSGMLDAVFNQTAMWCLHGYSKLKLTPQFFVESLVDERPRVAGASEFRNFSLTASVSATEDRTHSLSIGSTSSIGVQGTLGIQGEAGSLGVSAGHSWFRTDVVSTSESDTQSSSLSASRSMVGELRHFEIQAKGRMCVLITLDTTDVGWVPMQICRDKIVTKKIKETYAFFTQNWGNSTSPFLDLSESSQDQLRFFVRGQPNVDAFVNVLQDKKHKILLRDQIGSLSDTIERGRLESADIGIPGAFVEAKTPVKVFNP